MGIIPSALAIRGAVPRRTAEATRYAPSGIAAGAAAALTLLLAIPASASTPLATLDGAPDVTAALGGVTVADQEVARDDLGGLITRIDLGLPAAVALDGFHNNLDGTVLFSLDTAATVGGTAVTAADVVLWDPAAQSAGVVGPSGVPAGVGVDAVAVDGTDLLLSFEVAVTLSGVLFADEDLARWDGVAFSLLFDGSSEGVPAALDLDAAHRLTNGHLLLSFDGSGVVAGVAFDDEDVLEHDPATGAWEMAYDASLVHPGWAAADRVALAAREPGQLVAAGELRFSSPTFSAFEIQPFATITVERFGGTAGAVSVTFTASDGTAMDALDYTAVSGTLSWGDGDGAPKSFDVPVIDDTLTEGDETVVLTLSDPTGGAVLGVPGTALLTLVDDETTPVPVLAIPVLGGPAMALLAALLALVALVVLRGRL